jgi:hypothetical protein
MQLKLRHRTHRKVPVPLLAVPGWQAAIWPRGVLGSYPGATAPHVVLHSHCKVKDTQATMDRLSV